MAGDMRSLPFEREFDAVYSYYTSFGYFGDDENERVLAGVARALKPGGRFLLEMANRDWILTHPLQRVWNQREDGSLHMEESSLDLVTSRVVSRLIHITPDGGPRLTKEYELRVYTCAELTALCARHGLAVRQVWGGADRSAYGTESRRLVLLAERSAAAGVRQDAAAGAPPESAPARAVPVAAPVGVEAFLPGGEWRGARGAVFVHECLRSQVERRRDHWGSLEAPPAREPALAELARAGLRHALFLDLETCGLASSAVFLAGTMHWNGSDFVLRQFFARHYGEEAALLEALAEAARGFEFLITFNGKSYDAPFLAGRALVNRVALRLPPRHLDLLHPARRRWRWVLPDCRLQTLERHVCRRHRSGDVPGEAVPGLYHDFVRHGDAYRLVPVFHHNLLDVITMAEIMRALCGPERDAER